MAEIFGSIFGYGVAFLVLFAINLVIVWLGLVISGLSTSVKGLAIIAASISAPQVCLPMLVAPLVGTVLFWVFALKFTSADGFGDIVILNGVTNVVSTWVSFFVLLGGIGVLSSLDHEEYESSDSAQLAYEEEAYASEENGTSEPAARPRSAYTALKGQLSQEELALINQATAAR